MEWDNRLFSTNGQKIFLKKIKRFSNNYKKLKNIFNSKNYNAHKLYNTERTFDCFEQIIITNIFSMYAKKMIKMGILYSCHSMLQHRFISKHDHSFLFDYNTT